MHPKRTLIAVCFDPRLRQRQQELFDYYYEQDGAPPFVLSSGGGCFPFTDPGFLRRSVQPVIRLGVTHVHLENHMGADSHTHGCWFFHDLHDQRRSGDYLMNEEYNDHQDKLSTARLRTLKLAEKTLFSWELTANTGIFHHDDAGDGYCESLVMDRETFGLPGLQKSRQY